MTNFKNGKKTGHKK